MNYWWSQASKTAKTFHEAAGECFIDKVNLGVFFRAHQHIGPRALGIYFYANLTLIHVCGKPIQNLVLSQENASIWVFLSHQKTFICSDRELDIKYRESLFQKSQPVENLATWVKFRVGNWQQNPRPEGCCGNWGSQGFSKTFRW